jgi:hypothetical protein
VVGGLARPQGVRHLQVLNTEQHSASRNQIGNLLANKMFLGVLWIQIHFFQFIPDLNVTLKLSQVKNDKLQLTSLHYLIPTIFFAVFLQLHKRYKLPTMLNRSDPVSYLDPEKDENPERLYRIRNLKDQKSSGSGS